MTQEGQYRMKWIALLLSTAALLGAQNDLNGKWDVTATPDGKSPIKLDALLEHNGHGLTGTVTSLIGSGPVKNATVADPDLKFQFMLGKYTFDVKAVAAAGEMKGTFKGPGLMKGTFLAKKSAADAPAATTATPVEGVEVGILGAAQYRIDLPKEYNGKLIVYCHGYSPVPGRFDKDKAPTPLTQAFLDLGYAVAQSGYSAGGWAVKEAIEETEALRQHFVINYGKPKQTFVTGHSMGGTITLALAESFPEAYDAALQMCGPVGPTLTTFQSRLFDLLVVYDYYFPDMIGSPTNISEEVLDSEQFALRVQKEATAYPDRMEALQKFGGFANDLEMAKTLTFFALIQKELLLRAGGNPFDNRNTVYQGTTNDPVVNRGVKRYAADPAAREYLKKYYTPKAEPKLPILSLHTTYDPLITAASANAYGEMLRLNGGEANYVQRFVGRSGHCAFTPQETLRAFNDLVTWKETGQRPESGEQK